MTSPRSNDPVESSSSPRSDSPPKYNVEKELAFLWEIVKHLRRMAARDTSHKRGERYYITVIYKDGPVSWMWQDHKYGVATLHKENREPKTEVNFENPLLFQVDDGVLTKGSGYDFIDCLQLLTEIRRYTILDVLADV